MASLRRFSDGDIAVLQQMAERGFDGRAIGAALNRTPQAIRTKAVEVGVALRPPSLDARRFRLKPDTWLALQAEAKRLRTKPSKLARQIVEVVMADGLLDAVIDPPRSLRRQTKRDPKWAGRLAARQFGARPEASESSGMNAS